MTNDRKRLDPFGDSELFQRLKEKVLSLFNRSIDTNPHRLHQISISTSFEGVGSKRDVRSSPSPHRSSSWRRQIPWGVVLLSDPYPSGR
jgi:hypothetical protein